MAIDQQSIISFDQILSEKYNHLTKSEKRIGEFIRQNQEESAFLTAVELAKRLEFSEATLVRFARSIGFTSYSAMRTYLQDAFRNSVAHSRRLSGRLEKLKQEGDVFESLVVSEIDYLSKALDTVDRQALKKAVQIINSCENIFLMGRGASISLINLLDVRLRRYGRHVIPLTASDREILEFLSLMKSNDMLFMICYLITYPSQMLALEYASELHCPIVLLTESIRSEICKKADVILSVKRAQVGEDHSLLVPMTIINTLLLMYVYDKRDSTMTVLDKSDQLQERLKNIGDSRN